MDRSELRIRVREILSQQIYGVLATNDEGGPHTTIVSFAAADDLHCILFPTPQATRKYRNLLRDPAVSLFIDTRSDDPSDIENICGIEARGIARELNGAQRERYEPIYRARHPQLTDFAGHARVAENRCRQVRRGTAISKCICAGHGRRRRIPGGRSMTVYGSGDPGDFAKSIEAAGTAESRSMIITWNGLEPPVLNPTSGEAPRWRLECALKTEWDALRHALPRALEDAVLNWLDDGDTTSVENRDRRRGCQRFTL
jgi:uncharacterized protein YhbP (UPF0306 family)